MGEIPDGVNATSHGICPTCECISCGQNALMLVIASSFDLGQFSEADRAEVREAYALLDAERQRRAERQTPVVASDQTKKEGA
jgi:NADH:ubiquinone oxidoreductase subunit B-like Fe-S oxidoreductase